MRMKQGLRFDWFSPSWRGDITVRGWRYVLIALGVFVWAIAVFLMVEGGILGARTTDVATLLGMVGIFIILVTYMHAMMLGKAERVKAFLIEQNIEVIIVETDARAHWALRSKARKATHNLSMLRDVEFVILPYVVRHLLPLRAHAYACMQKPKIREKVEILT